MKTLINEFKTLYPDFPETFGEDNEEIEQRWESHDQNSCHYYKKIVKSNSKLIGG